MNNTKEATIYCRVDAALYRRVKIACAERGITLQQFVASALLEYMEDHGEMCWVHVNKGAAK